MDIGCLSILLCTSKSHFQNMSVFINQELGKLFLGKAYIVNLLLQLVNSTAIV